MSNYFNPVQIIKTNDWHSELNKKLNDLGIIKPVFITSQGNRKRLNLDDKYDSKSIFCDVVSNPNFDNCEDALQFCNNKMFDGVVALGGGSVMDLAKVVMAHLSLGLSDIFELINYKEPYSESIPSIFLPTTQNPTSGFLLFVPKKDAIRLTMTVEEGIKMIISAGMLTPSENQKRIKSLKKLRK